MSTQSKGFDWVRAAPWLYTIGLFVIWELVVRLFSLPQFLLPAPSRIAEAIWQFWPAIWKNSLQTLYTTTVGFILAVIGGVSVGLPLGLARSTSARGSPPIVGL